MNGASKPGVANVWKNRRKTEQRHPDFTTNSLTIPGVEGTFECCVWGPKRASSGDDYFTVQIKPAWKPTGERPPQKPAPTSGSGYEASRGYVGGDDDEDAPF